MMSQKKGGQKQGHGLHALFFSKYIQLIKKCRTYHHATIFREDLVKYAVKTGINFLTFQHYHSVVYLSRSSKANHELCLSSAGIAIRSLDKLVPDSEEVFNSILWYVNLFHFRGASLLHTPTPIFFIHLMSQFKSFIFPKPSSLDHITPTKNRQLLYYPFMPYFVRPLPQHNRQSTLFNMLRRSPIAPTSCLLFLKNAQPTSKG